MALRHSALVVLTGLFARSFAHDLRMVVLSATDPDGQARAAARRADLSSDRYYTPTRVADGLRALPRDDPFPGATRDPRLPRRRRTEPWHAFEGPACERADLHRALLALPWFERFVAWMYYVRGESYEAIAAALGAAGHPTSRNTVATAAKGAPEALARALGWDGPPAAEARDEGEGRIRVWLAEVLKVERP